MRRRGTGSTSQVTYPKAVHMLYLRSHVIMTVAHNTGVAYLVCIYVMCTIVCYGCICFRTGVHACTIYFHKHNLKYTCFFLGLYM